ncbi:MAG: hypothetical protein U0414_27175 [Polyangiaceae bacterium]
MAHLRKRVLDHPSERGALDPGAAPRRASRSLPHRARQAGRAAAAIGAIAVQLACAPPSEKPATEKPRTSAAANYAPPPGPASGPAASSAAPIAPPPPSALVAKDPPPPADPGPFFPHTDWWGDEAEAGVARDRGAKSRRTEKVTKLFADAGVKFPAAEILFRVFKKEWKLEVWANDEKGTALKPIATYGICMISGILGPKHHEGDLQVPEGFYTLNYITTATNYHLAMYVNYPNPWDKRQSPVSPGSDILVHGSCASIGCVSMGDETIEELWTMASPLYAKNGKIQMHVFPARDMKAVEADPEMAANVSFWKMIEPTLAKFDKDHLLPTVSFNPQGKYVVDGQVLDLVD